MLMSDVLKAYPSPWKGHLILACKKCQKKLKGESGLAKLKKAVKGMEAGGERLYVLNVGCMDVCPKGGVAVVDPRRGLYILRSEDDAARLIETIASIGKS